MAVNELRSPKVAKTPKAVRNGRVAVRGTTPAKRLRELPGLIKEAHGRCEGAVRSYLEHARQAGELLLEAKELVAHGNFQAWQDEHVTLGTRTVQRYMLIARHWPQIEEKFKNDTVSHSGYTEALEYASSLRGVAVMRQSAPKAEPPNAPKTAPPKPIPAAYWNEDPAEAAEQEEHLRAETARLVEKQKADEEAGFDLATAKERIRAFLGGECLRWPPSQKKDFFPVVRAVVEAMEADDKERHRAAPRA
jgi:hypothetical protein